MAQGVNQKAMQEKLADSQRLIDEEVQLWEEKGLNIHGSISPNIHHFHFACRLIAMQKIMMDKLGVTDDEFQLVMNEVVLKELGEWREKLFEQFDAFKEQQLRQALAPPPGFKLPPFLPDNGKKG
jgi:hypothetical protein